MRKQKRVINLGEEFTEKKDLKSDYLQDFKQLYECFNSWSSAKQYVFNKYDKMLYDNCDEVLNYGIRGYNSMIITLHAEVIKNGHKYYLLITPAHNYYEEVE